MFCAKLAAKELLVKLFSMEAPDSSDRIEVTDKAEYQIYEADWQGIALTIRHCPRWLCSHGETITQHIEIRSEGKVALPVTETGYRSHFMNGAEALAEFDDSPTEFVLAWLDEAANSKEWQAKVEAARQYLLF